jgi:hypothetical protein
MRSAAGSWIAGILLFAFGAIRIAHTLPARSHENDFAHYYVTSRLWLEGKDPYRTAFAPEFAKYGFRYDSRIPSGGNAPPLVAAFAPFAAFPPAAAFGMWVALETACLLVTLLMIAVLLKDRVPARLLPLLIGLLVASSALYFHFYFSQVQLLLGALLLGAYMLHRSGRYASALTLATMAALLKLFPAVVLPWFVLVAPGSLHERVRRLLPALLVATTTVALTWTLWPGFLHGGSAIVTDAVANQTFNFSLPSLVVNLGWAHYDFVPTAREAGRVWLIGNAAGVLLIASAYLAVYDGRVDQERGFCAVLLVSTVASPTAWGHYFVLGFLPFSVFCAPLLANLTGLRVLAIGFMYALTLNLGDGVSLPSGLMGRLNDAFPIPYALRVFYAYFPLYGCLALAATLCSTRGGAPDATVPNSALARTT